MKNVLFSILIAGSMWSSVQAQDYQGPSQRPGRIQRRRENQQDRIAQGVTSGQLTPGESASLEHKEAGLNGEIRSDRAANGGALSIQERRQVNRQQNRLSKNIYRDKHNGKVQPK